MISKNTPISEAEKKQLFEKVIEDSRNSIYRICRSYLYDLEATDDLFQEILIQVWNSLDQFRAQSSWNTYIYRISINTAITFNKNAKKQHKRHLQQDVSELSLAAEISSESSEQKLDKLLRAIQKLSDPDRLVISLVLEDLSYKQIAEYLHISTSNVGIKINRAKKRIQKIVERDE